jgi:hypothetical protein
VEHSGIKQDPVYKEVIGSILSIVVLLWFAYDKHQKFSVREGEVRLLGEVVYYRYRPGYARSQEFLYHKQTGVEEVLLCDTSGRYTRCVEKKNGAVIDWTESLTSYDRLVLHASDIQERNE